MGNMGLYVLFVSGEEDPCLVNEDKFHKSVRFMYELGYKYVKEILYPGMRHEILNEKGKEKVWNDIVNGTRDYRELVPEFFSNHHFLLNENIYLTQDTHELATFPHGYKYLLPCLLFALKVISNPLNHDL